MPRSRVKQTGERMLGRPQHTIQSLEPIEIYVDGRGERADGCGSGFAWKQPKTGRQEVIWEDHLTNNQAEYKALLLAIKALPASSTARILTDSQIVSEQFNGRYAVHDPTLDALLKEVAAEISGKSLHISVAWVPRAANLADKLLSSKGAKFSLDSSAASSH